jgi:hypothetical protein
MKRIGLLTEDPRTYYETLEVLRERGLRHVSLEFGDPVPAHVGVVISTERERDRVPFDVVVTDDDPDAAVLAALRLLGGDVSVRSMRIGVDPGQRPGVAAVGDGVVLARAIAQSPEKVSDVVDRMVRDYPCADVLVRVGNGDRTNRNRIFNTLWDKGHRLEIVDERNTTTRSETPDEDAAVEIAMTPGYRPVKRQAVRPCDGELRNIQRLSRLESNGRLTVSKELAEKVALGEMSLDEALNRQRANGNGRSVSRTDGL